MTNINQLSSRGSIQPQDQLAYWNQNNGQPRRTSVSDLITLITQSLVLNNGLLSAGTLYALRRTQAETIALTTNPAIVAPYDANGNTILESGRTALTQNVVTGVMQTTRVIAAAQFWVALLGSAPNGDVITLQVQTGPAGGPMVTSEFQQIQVANGNAQAFAFQGILRNPNNINGQLNQGDFIQLVASSSAPGNLSLTAASFIVMPLDGV